MDSSDPQDNRQRPLGLSTAQVLGSALAAVSGAFAASWAGTTGTIIGTAVASVVATIGASMYTYSLHRTSDAVKRTATQVRQTALLTNSLPRTVSQGPLRPGELPGERTGGDGDGDTVPPDRRLDLPWGKVALASVVVGLIALAGITTFEALTGRPVSSYTGGGGDGTTLGNVTGADTTDEPTPPSTPSPSAEPTQEPTQAPTVPTSSQSPTAAPSSTDAPSAPPAVTPSSTIPAP